jgi:hypothetical protein
MSGRDRRCRCWGSPWRRIRGQCKRIPESSSVGKSVWRTSGTVDRARRFWPTFDPGTESQPVWRPCPSTRLRSASATRRGGVWPTRHAGRDIGFQQAGTDDGRVWATECVGREAEPVWGAGIGAASAASLWAVRIWPTGNARRKAEPLWSTRGRRGRICGRTECARQQSLRPAGAASPSLSLRPTSCEQSTRK